MLTPAQQTTLDYHLRQTNRLTNKELIQELTDHYTIALGEHMAQGMTFETALTNAQQAFGGIAGLQRMEQGYNRITFRKYDSLWMQYIWKQISWPRGLRPLCTYILSYLMLMSANRPTSFSMDTFLYNPYSGLVYGAILGLIIKIGQLALQSGISGGNVFYKAIYLATRVLPIAVLLYGIYAGLTYLNTYMPPYVYEATMSACAALTVAYMISYSQFYQAVLKKRARVS